MKLKLPLLPVDTARIWVVVRCARCREVLIGGNAMAYNDFIKQLTATWRAHRLACLESLA